MYIFALNYIGNYILKYYNFKIPLKWDIMYTSESD